MPVGFLTDVLGPDSVLAVEIAWGATGTDDSGWIWSDVTEDVSFDDPISITLGRSDEASTSQPAKCSMTLDNTSARYSLGPWSPNYPYVRRNVPVRVWVDVDDTGAMPLFQGYATGFTPSWKDLTGNIARVELAANGVLRRLNQRRSPTRSALSNYLFRQDGVVLYWSCEDGDESTRFASGKGNDVSALNATSGVSFAEYDELKSSDDLPTLDDGLVHGAVPEYPAAWDQGVFWLAVFPEEGYDGSRDLMEVTTEGHVQRWRVRVSDQGGLKVIGLDADGGEVFDTGFIGFEVFGKTLVMYLRLRQDGSDTFWQIATFNAETWSSLDQGGTVDDNTYNRFTTVQFGDSAGLGDTVIGHIGVMSSTDLAAIWTEIPEALNAWRGQNAVDRLQALTSGNGVPLQVTGSSRTAMGPQTPETFLDLIREVEATDMGVLLDGSGPGLHYVCREERENAPAAIALDVPAGELAGELEPTDDDQRNVNRVEVQQKDGSAIIRQDVDGPLGIDTIGLYEDEVTINLNAEGEVRDYATWMLHLGTIEGYRFPEVVMTLAAAPSTAWAKQVLSAGVSRRIDLVNPAQVLTALPDEDVSLVIEGLEIELSPHAGTVTAKCSPQEPWRVIEVAANSGDNGEFVAHLDTLDSTLDADAAEGDTTLTVATNAGPIWTRRADDFPFRVAVGGVPVTVTDVSGSSSPQTFTVEPISRDVSAGDQVAVYKPPVLGL